jgi:hypothetical protein
MRFALIIALLVFMAKNAGADDSPHWITISSLDDVKDSSVYKAISDFDGKHYETTIYGRDLMGGIGKWDEGKELTFSMAQIRVVARDSLVKSYPQYSKFKLASLNLVHLNFVDCWVFDVAFDGADYTASPSAFHERTFHLVVLLNGRVVLPK